MAESDAVFSSGWNAGFSWGKAEGRGGAFKEVRAMVEGTRLEGATAETLEATSAWNSAIYRVLARLTEMEATNG